MSDLAKSTGLIANIKSDLAAENKVFIFYFFKDSLKKLESILDEQNLPLVDLERSQSSSSIISVQASELEHSMRLQNSLKEFLNKGNCTLLFLEHYPLYSKEQLVLERIASLVDSKLNACFHVSLNEPIMKSFGSSSILQLMKSMGVKEEESMQHSSIDSALSTAQKKLEKKALGDSRSDSIEEWFKRNSGL